MSKLQDVENAVVSGKSKLVAGLVQEALDEGCSAPDILNGMINAMGIVGERFKKNEIFVPEMLVEARAKKRRRCIKTSSCFRKRWCLWKSN